MTTAKIIPFPTKSKDELNYGLYIEAMIIQSERTGIDYFKLYTGTDEERAVEKLKVEARRLEQKIACMYLEPDE